MGHYHLFQRMYLTYAIRVPAAVNRPRPRPLLDLAKEHPIGCADLTGPRARRPPVSSVVTMR